MYFNKIKSLAQCLHRNAARISLYTCGNKYKNLKDTKMNKITSKIRSLLLAAALFAPVSTLHAALIDVSSLSVDTVSANINVGSVVNTGATTSIIPPAEILMGSYQNPLLPLSSSFNGGTFTGNIYTTNAFGEPAPSATVNTMMNEFDSVDLSSMRISGTLDLGGLLGSYSFDTELWPLTTTPTSSYYDQNTGDFSISWAFSEDIMYDITSPLGSSSSSITSAFDLTISGTATVVPVPAAVWLFMSGLIGLAGVARKRK